MRRTTATLALVAALTAALSPAVLHAADDPSVTLSEGWRFAQRDGASLYRAICQGCHMADGRGAQGAGAYPALAGNARLGSATYVTLTVLNGRRAMPGFGRQLDDAQVAAIVNQVRGAFATPSTEPVSASDVRALR